MSAFSLYCPECEETLAQDEANEAIASGRCPDCEAEVEVQT